MRAVLRVSVLAFGVINLVLAAGFFFQQPGAVGLWPWQMGRLSFIFIASILAAVAAALLWAGVTNHLRALPAGQLNLAVMLGGIGGYLVLAAQEPGRGGLLPYGVGAGLLALLNLGFFVWLVRWPAPEPVPLPRLVR